MHPIGLRFVESIRGIKDFNDFKKAPDDGILKVSNRFSNIIKWKEYQMDPIVRRVPLGDKTFSRFQKARLQVRILKVSKPFLKHNKIESKNNWTTFGAAFAVPSGDKIFSRF